MEREVVDELLKEADVWLVGTQYDKQLMHFAQLCEVRTIADHNLKGHEIVVGRLKRRIAKLIVQRDKAREETKHFRHVIESSPQILYRYKKFEDVRTGELTEKRLRTRVREQEELIQRLLKEKGE